MSDRGRLRTQHLRYPFGLRHALVALVAGATLVACGGTQDPVAVGDESSESGSSPVEETSPATTPAQSTGDPDQSAPEGEDEIPAATGDGVNERLLPDENLLGRIGWGLTGQSEDLTTPLYRHPCSPDSALEEYSDPISNVGRLWDVTGFNVPTLPAPAGQIGIDLYGYPDAATATQAFSHYAGNLESCGEAGPDGTLDKVIADVNLDASGPNPLDQGFIVRTGSETSHSDVIIARMGQIILVTAYLPEDSGQLGDVDTTALSEAVLSPGKEVIGASY